MNNTLVNLIMAALIVVAGILGALGGYRYGYDRANLEGQVLVAQKDGELKEAKAAAAAAPARGDAGKKEKTPFAPSTLSTAQLAPAQGLADLSGKAQENALYVLNNVAGGCQPCADTGRSLGQCLLDEAKLLDKSLCKNIPKLVSRTVRLAGQEKSVDEIKAAVDLGVWTPIDPGDAPREGGKNARVTIIEYSDFQCPYCKKAVPTIHALLEKYGDRIAIAFMHQPLEMHKMAMPAAKAAMAANLQEKFWPFHDALFTAPKLDEEQLKIIASQLGLDIGRWEADRASSAIDARVGEDVRKAQKYGISSTPMFFVNGYKVKGAQPQPVFERLIDAELADG